MSFDEKTALSTCQSDARRFWEGRPIEDEEERGVSFYMDYIEQRLPKEIELAKLRKRLPNLADLRDGHCDILVLLVGFSLEPLLQAICAYRPKEIVPVLNSRYSKRLSGEEMKERLNQLLEKLREQEGLDPGLCLRETTPLIGHSPSDVFHFLQEQLQSSWKTKSIVIDITGAKKSMVAGAFFFAAYSNIPISYVDFDEYLPGGRRPSGCDSKIDFIPNPYSDFYLRDWVRVKHLYEQYAFAAAREEATWIYQEMRRSALSTKPQERAVLRLIIAIALLHEWDNGDYRSAYKRAQDEAAWLPLEELPWAIQSLGPNWPSVDTELGALGSTREYLVAHGSLKRGRERPEDSIFAQPAMLLAYAEDELAKVERLVAPKEDYRAAFLRAVGLEEFLWKARLAMCWLHGDFLVDGTAVGEAQWKPLFDELVDHASADQMRDALRTRKSLQLGQTKPRPLGMLSEGAPKMNDYWRELDLGWSNKIDRRTLLGSLRGEAIHTHLYLTEKIARCTLDVARKGVEDFRNNWLDRYHPGALGGAKSHKFCEPDWDDLCKWCRVDYLLPYLGGEKEEETQ